MKITNRRQGLARKTARPLVFYLALIGLCSACGGRPLESSATLAAASTWRPVIRDHLRALAADALPEVSADSLQKILDLLDLASTGEIGQRQAQHRLSEREKPWLTAAMLDVVESRSADVLQKREAYRWLQENGLEAMLPRLTLRIKYEKDWTANVDIALGLLRYGSGAGLEALITILRTEKGVKDLRQARWAAVQALQHLAPAPGWNPGDSFDADWKRLLQVEQVWRQQHFLAGFSEQLPPSHFLQAALWQTLAKLRSQPLRPVDDARFVLIRLPSWVFSSLCLSTRDESPYVREHTLQILAWIGTPVGSWAKRNNFDLVASLSTLLADPPLRARVLEAMGASGLSSMQTEILPWLSADNLEQSTAAADALLRCANSKILGPLKAFLATKPILSPEGRFALQCLWSSLDPQHTAQRPATLDPSEQTRRERWKTSRPL